MVNIVNVIKTMFTTAGAPAVAGAVNSITAATGKASAANTGLTKTTTRQGEASTNATRAFAAQSKGLGGLVAAYAGAASTSYVLSAAFDILGKAAQSENIIRGTNTLAAALGQSGPQIINSIQDITDGQLSLVEASRSANLALSAGFNSKQIESFTSVAMKASLALGRDFADSFDRVIKGSAKLQPELLDELGIMTRLDPAVKAYARQMGIAATSVSAFEKTQAFANAVITEGTRKFADINTSAPSAQKSLQQLQTQVTNLTNTFTQWIAEGLLPFVNFLKNSAGSTVLLFGGLILLVFGKAKSIISDFGSESLKSMTSWADNTVARLGKVKSSFAELGKTTTKFDVDLLARGGLSGKVAAPAGGPAANTGRFNQAGVSKDIANEASKVRQRFIAAEVRSLEQMKVEVASLTKVINQLTVAQKTNTYAFEDAIRIRQAYNVAIAASGTGAALLTKGIAGISFVLKILGKIAGGILSTFNWVFLIISGVQMLGELFGVDFVGWLTTAVGSIGKLSEEIKTGLVGAFSAAAGGSSVLNAELKKLGATDSELEKVPDRLLSISKEIDNNLTAQQQHQQPMIAYALEELGGPTSRDRQESIPQAVTSVDVAAGMLARKRREVADAKASNSEVSIETLKDIALLKAALDGLTMYDPASFGFLTALGSSAGLGVEQLAKTLTAAGTSFVGLGDSLTVYGVTFQKTIERTFDLRSVSQNLQDFVENSALIDNAIQGANASYNAGSASASTLGSVIGNLRVQILKSNSALSAEVIAQQARNTSIDAAVAMVNKETAALNKQKGALAELIAKRDELQRIEDIYKGINTAFSKEIGLGSAAIYAGDLAVNIDKAGNASLKVASSDKEIAQNRQNILLDTLTTFESAHKQQEIINNAYKTGVINLTMQSAALSNIQAGSEAYDEALKAVAGTLVNILLSTQKITTEQTKATISAQRELDLLKEQADMESVIATFAANQFARQAKITSLQAELDLGKANLDLETKRLGMLEKEAEAAANLAKNRRAGGNAAVADTRIGQIGKEVSSIAGGLDTAAGQLAGKAWADVVTAAQEHNNNKHKELEKGLITAKELSEQAITAGKIALFDKETTIMVAKIAADKMAIAEQYVVQKMQLEAEAKKLETSKSIIRAEAAIVQGQLDGYRTFAVGVQGFANASSNLAIVFNQFLQGLPKFLGATANVQIPAKSDVMGQVNSSIAGAQTALDTSTNTQLAVVDAQITAINTKAGNLFAATIAQLKAKGDEESALLLQREAERSGLILDLADSSNTANNAIADLGSAADKAGEQASKLRDNLLSLFDLVQGSFKDAFMSLNDFVVYGDGSIKEILGSFFKTLQQGVFERTIATPISDTITSRLFGNTRQGIEKAKLDKNGYLMVHVAGWAESIAGSGLTGKDALGTKDNKATTGAADTALDLIKTPFDGFIKQMSDLFGGIFGPNGIVGQLFGGIFGKNGILGNLFSGLMGGGAGGGGGNFLSTIFTAITSMFASGGVVHMAQGGAVNSHLRDRVPAMLEPGEFVVNKIAAKRAGIPALNSLNGSVITSNFNKQAPAAPVINMVQPTLRQAPGTLGGSGPASMGDVTVNVSNEGSAKTATASPPRFDGDKYVIDVIMRDLSNNGPIRRSLRGGAL